MLIETLFKTSHKCNLRKALPIINLNIRAIKFCPLPKTSKKKETLHLEESKSKIRWSKTMSSPSISASKSKSKI